MKSGNGTDQKQLTPLARIVETRWVFHVTSFLAYTFVGEPFHQYQWSLEVILVARIRQNATIQPVGMTTSATEESEIGRQHNKAQSD